MLSVKLKLRTLCMHLYFMYYILTSLWVLQPKQVGISAEIIAYVLCPEKVYNLIGEHRVGFVVVQVQ